jgi:Uma2 family endonuclease
MMGVLPAGRGAPMRIGIKTKLDYADYADLPSDGHRYEILDGDLTMTPAPSPRHQRVSRRLQRALEDHFQARDLGEVFNAPIDVILTDRDVVQPDLVVVAEPAQVSARGIEGPPLLVVEVLSPATRTRDRTVKARRYAELGVPHYWLVDPEGRRVECYRLEAGAYALACEAADDATLAHPAWPDLAIPLGALWR